MKSWVRSVSGSRPAGLAATCAALFALSLAGDGATRALRYERSALAAGEWWRALSCHLVHFDLRHLLLNLAGLGLLWLLFVRDARTRDWFAVALAAALAVAAGLWWLQPDVAWYLGLSGVLHGAWAAAAVAALPRWRLEGQVTGALLAAKLAAEQVLGPLSGEAAGTVPVLTASHLYGALGGLSAALALTLWRRRL